MSNKVQLKQENVVGESVVLEDINPKTDTDAVTDLSSGSSMSETLDRIWDAINNKLSRVVNSVNGRTGVVVLKPEDVGLGNVDNISFATIKKEIMDALETGFSAKHIMLFNTMSDAENIILTNDKKYTDTPFYVQHVSESDKKSRIGYFYFDISDNKLKYNTKDIATVGYTDNSIIYDENVNGNNLSGGGIGVNIWKHEDALKLYNDSSGDKSESGLMIDKDTLLPRVIYLEGMYKSDRPTPSWYDNEGFLYFDNEDIPHGTPVSEIYFVTDFTSHREKQYVYAYVKRKDLRDRDLIICGFAPYTTIDDSSGEDVVSVIEGCNPLLVGRGTSIGVVKEKPSGGFKIYFYKIHENVGWGLQKITSHFKAGESLSQPTFATDEYAELKLTNGMINNVIANTSGLQVFYQTSEENLPDNYIDTNLKDDLVYTITPAGTIKTKSNAHMALYGYGGLSVLTDSTIAISPSRWFDESTDNGSFLINNWANKSPHGVGNEHESGIDKIDTSGVLKDTSLLSVNVDKLMIKNADSTYKVANASGLKVIKSQLIDSAPKITKTFFTKNGCSDSEATTNMTVDDFKQSIETGGIAVNVGKFLEIGNVNYRTHTSNFDDGGKVNVRIGDGLVDDGENKIKVKINERSMKFNSYGIGVKYDTMLTIRDYGTEADIDLSNPSEFDFLSINFGKGLHPTPKIYGFYKQDASGFGRFYSNKECTDEIAVEDDKLYCDRKTQTIYVNTSSSGLQKKDVSAGEYGLEVYSDSTLHFVDTRKLSVNYDNSTIIQNSNNKLTVNYDNSTIVQNSNNKLTVNYDNSTIVQNSNKKLTVNFDDVTIHKNSDGKVAVKHGLGLTPISDKLAVDIELDHNKISTRGLSFGEESSLRLNLYGMGRGGDGKTKSPDNSKSSIGIYSSAYTISGANPKDMNQKYGYLLVTRKRHLNFGVGGSTYTVPETDIKKTVAYETTYDYDPLDGCDTIEEGSIKISTAVIDALGDEITDMTAKSSFFEIYKTDDKNIKIVLKLKAIKEHLKLHWND